MGSRDSNLGSVTYFNVIHLSSDEGRRWIESRTGQKVDFDKLCVLKLPWANTRRLYIESTSQSQPNPELPSRVIVDRYVGLYCSSFLGLVFPVISKSLFTKTLDLAYGLRHDFGADSARSCVYAFLSVVALFGFDESMHGAMDCGSYASSAQTYMAQIIQEMTLSGLQSLIMLVRISFWLHAFRRSMGNIMVFRSGTDWSIGPISILSRGLTCCSSFRVNRNPTFV